jgi:hypothetical protein
MAKVNKTNIAKLILDHTDKEEIISKLLMDISCSDINEWLSAKFDPISEKHLIISEKNLSIFKDEYLDLYTTIREDLLKTRSNLTVEDQVKMEVHGNRSYHKALEKYIDQEVDIKTMVKKMVSNVEERISQIYDEIQQDTRNFRDDRILVEYFNTLLSILEKYDNIINGSPDQINIQNNINIQILDEHIGVIYNIIREILAGLDYDTSLQFVERFQSEMQKLKGNTKDIIPFSERLSEVENLQKDINSKL